MADLHSGRGPSRSGAAPDRSDEGSALVALPVAVALLLLVTLAVAIPWGDAAASRTTSRAAADAAALAAADAWDDALLPLWAPVLGGDRAAAVHLLALPPQSHALARVRAAAQRYAESNGEDLVSLTVVARPGSAIGFEAVTRARRAVTGSQLRTEATALAEVRLDAGPCITGTGFGLRTPAGCLTTLPKPPGARTARRWGARARRGARGADRPRRA